MTEYTTAVDTAVGILFPTAFAIAYIVAVYSALHYFLHARKTGHLVTWRRKADGVLMVGNKCPLCSKVLNIHPSRISYRHMLARTRKFDD